MTLPTQQALSDAELEQLATFLDGLGDTAMNIEMLDGYLAALICSPEMLLPSEYLTQIFGQEHSFDGSAQASEIIGLVMRHWNAIASDLLRTLEHDEVYFPVLMGDENGVAYGNDWAYGFMCGVQLRPHSWVALIESDSPTGLMAPILILAHELDPDPARRSPEITDEQREELLQSMVDNLPRIYRHFEPQRKAESMSVSPTPLRRQGVKVGRNDPCPCGSGKKYKHCCAITGPSFR